MQIINQKINQSFSLFVLFFGMSSVIAQNNIKIVHKPEQPLKEKINNQNSLNFDFIIENNSKDTLQLTRLEVLLFDKNNVLIQQKFLDNNGTAPSINTIPTRQWNGASKSML